jgi:predicted negative regulator of RcsB-dependent stress response
MRAGPGVWLQPCGATAPLLAVLIASIAAFATPAQALDDELGGPTDIEQPADVAPGGAEMRLEDELIEPPDFDPDALMRPDVKQGGEDGPPPQSTEESKQDKLLGPSFDELPLPAPMDKPKMLAGLYEQLGKARDAEAAQPIVEAIEALWRISGSDTVDLLMHRAERFAKADDLDLALNIMDATVDIAPDQAEAWHLRAKVNYLKKNYELALADLRRVLNRDSKHYAAMNDLGVVLEAIGAKKEALEAYRKAIAINPFLGETKKAVEELRREVEGQDI